MPKTISDAMQRMDSILRRGWWMELRSPFTLGDVWRCGITPLNVIGWNGQPDREATGDTAIEAIMQCCDLWDDLPPAPDAGEEDAALAPVQIVKEAPALQEMRDLLAGAASLLKDKLTPDWEGLSKEARSWLYDLGRFQPMLHEGGHLAAGLIWDGLSDRAGEATMMDCSLNAATLRQIAAALNEAANWLDRQPAPGAGEEEDR